MRLQQGAQRRSVVFSEQLNITDSNFKEKIPTYIKQIKNSVMKEQSDEIGPPSIIKSLKFKTQKNNLKSEVSTTLQTSHKFYLFLGRKLMQNCSELIIYEYLKEDGKNKSMKYNGIKDEIVCLKAKYCYSRAKIFSSKRQVEQNYKKSSSHKNNSENFYQCIIFMGTSHGYLKTLRFHNKINLDQENIKIQQIKLDYTQLIDIKFFQSSYFQQKNVCLTLSITNKVYLVNFDIMQTLVCFFPTIMSCEAGLSLSINSYKLYFIQSCEGGYIIFWDINEHMLSVINKSCTQKVDKQINIPENESPYKSNFKSKELVHCITPLNIFHSAVIEGLKYCELYGNLILLITRLGRLKLLSINSTSHSYVSQNQYCTLFQYQIDEGHLVSDVKFFSFRREIFIAKSLMYQETRDENYLPIKQYKADIAVKKGKKVNQPLINPYKPKTYRDLKEYVQPQKKFEKKQSNKNQINKCFFERIVFNSELLIEKHDKIYTYHPMDCIESIEMTNGKEIIVLRARQFYVIGTTSDIFSEDIDQQI